jgi:hypothetical protein
VEHRHRVGLPIGHEGQLTVQRGIQHGIHPLALVQTRLGWRVTFVRWLDASPAAIAYP